MYKKIISVMSVMLLIFLCFNYDVKADEVIDSSRRYNWLSTTQHYGNVDVTGNLFCLSDNPAMQSVNLSSAEYVGGGTTTNIVSTWESVYLWKFQATYVIKNNSDTYECFDNGRLYSQFSVTAKASTSASGSGTLHDDVVPSGWYIDNIQGAHLTNALSDGTMYWSVDHTYYGNTLIIAPGETITFSYDINIFWWEQSFGVGGTTFACQNGSISNTIGYTQQDGYHSYSVYEFITDYPFPSVDQYIAANIDSIWTNTQSLVSQGLVDQNLFNQIITILQNYPSSSVYPNTPSNFHFGYNQKANNNVYLCASFLHSGIRFFDNQVDYSFNNTNYRNLFILQKYYILSVTNNNDYAVSIPWRLHVRHRSTITSNYTYLGSSYSYDSDYFIPNSTSFSNDINDMYITNFNRSSIKVGAHSTIYIRFNVDYYYGSNTNDNITFSYANTNFTIDDFVATELDDIYNNFNNTNDDVHSSEMNYYSSTNTAIGNTGLDNFNFNQQESGGLSGVSDDFVRVWNACGSLNSVWVFALTLSLALYIIHHVPRQRSQ